MVKIKKISALLCLITMVFSLSSTITAASPSQVSSYPLAANTKESDQIIGLSVQPKGDIHYFSASEGNGKNDKTTQYSHYYSNNGGKSWSKKNIDWLSGYERTSFITMDSKSNIYFLAVTDTDVEKSTNDTYYTNNVSIIKVTDGIAKEIPNFKLQMKGMILLEILSVLDNGDIVLNETHYDTGVARVLTVAPQTGKIKHKIEFLNKSFLPQAYTQGIVYGTELTGSGDKEKIYFKDCKLSTGKQTLKIDFTPTREGFRVSSANDGFVYFASQEGLYCFNPQTSKFDRINSELDNGKKGCWFLSSSSGGNAYAIIANLSGKKDRKLYHYTVS